jgi:general secretion pathway protein D
VSGIPGLSQIPILKYLFSNVSDTVAEDEVLIVLKPHVVRLPDITPLNLRAVDVGTEGDVHLRQPGAIPEPGAQPPATLSPAPSSPAAPQAQPATPPVPADPTASARPAGAAADSARLRLGGENLNPKSGETFEVPVRIENARDVFSVPLELQYDSSAMQLVGVKKGDFWAADGLPVAIVERPEEEEGKTEVTLTRPPGSGGISGDGTVAVLTFRAAHAGSTALGVIPSGARSPAYGFLPVQGVQGTVTIR